MRIVISLISCFLFLVCLNNVVFSIGFEYFYDSLDRLVRVIDGQGNIITYDYDEVGNILAIRRNTVGDLPPPALTTAVPNQFTQGKSVTVILSGTSLLGGVVSTPSPDITIDNFLGTDTKITVNLTVSPTAQFGNTNLTVGTSSGMASIAVSVVPLQPRITRIAPGEGLIAGGTQVTLTGENFDPTARVSFGGVSATNVVFVDSTTLTAVTPPGPVNAPPVDVVVQVASLSDTLAGGFQYFDGIQYGDFVQDLIDPVGDEDSFPFSGQVGDLVVVRARPVNGTLVPNLQILGPSGVEGCSQSAPSFGGDRVELGCTLGASGLHTLVIKDVFGIGTGAYEFHIFRINNPVSALPINVGDEKLGSLASVVVVDVFQFAGTMGDQMILRLATTAGTLLPRFDVFRSDGTFVCGGSGLLAAERICELPSTDTYSIFVANLSGANTGAYALALQRLNGPVNPLPINLGSVQNLPLSSRVELSLFSLNSTAGEVLVVNFESLTALFDVQVRVFDPSGNSICSLQPINQPQGCPIAVSGNHTVLVTGGNNFGSPASGNYSLIINRLPNPVLSSSIAFGEQNTSTLDADVDMDVWSFSGIEGEGTVLRFSILNSVGAFNLAVQVLSVAGQTVCSQLVGQTAVDLVCELPVAGNYFVLVSDQGNNGNGSYNISLDQASGSVETTAISYGDITAKPANAGTNVNYWRFSGTAGDHAVFRLNPPGLFSLTQLQLFGPDNVRIKNCQAGGVTDAFGLVNMECSLSQTGQHTLVVNGNTGNTQLLGDYSVALQETNNPANPVAVGFGDIESRTLSHPLGLDAWIFEGSAGDQVFFRVGGATGGIEAELRVYGPTGLPVPNCQSPALQNPLERFCALDSTGTHVFVISDSLGDEAGAYNVFLEKTNAPSTSTPLNVGQTVSDLIQPSFETDVFTFSGNSGDQIQLTMTPTSGGIDPQIITLHQNGTPTNCINRNPLGQQLQVSCSLNFSGIHTVFVNDFGGDETGTYDLALTNP